MLSFFYFVVAFNFVLLINLCNASRKECASYMANLPVPFRYEYLMAETLFSQVKFCSCLNLKFLSLLSIHNAYERIMIVFSGQIIPVFPWKVCLRAVSFRFNN